jgi:hypothetical protein
MDDHKVTGSQHQRTDAILEHPHAAQNHLEQPLPFLCIAFLPSFGKLFVSDAL